MKEKSQVTWKQISSLFLSVCMVLTMLPMTAFAAVDDEFVEGNFKYKVLSEDTDAKTGTVALIGYESKPTGELTVTEAVYNNGVNYNVTEIGEDAFSYCSDVSKVSIPKTVESIGERAFAFCIFTEISIPDTVISIGNDAFGYCNNLKSISISKNVVSLGNIPFYVNHGLESINVDKGNANYSSNNGVLYDKSGNILLRYPANKSDTEFTIPDGVTTLAESSFYANNKLEKLIIPSTVSKIEEGTFYWAKALEDIRFLGYTPPTVEEDYTFNNTDELANIYVPAGKVDAYKSALSSVLSKAGKDTDIIKEYTIPGAIVVTTAEELKNALVSTTPQTIWVTTDINMGSALELIIVSANHSLIIEDGKTVEIEKIQLEVPEGITLTVKGTGILKANIGDASGISIVVRGVLKLTEGSILETNGYANILIDGGKIESLGSNISILNYIDNNHTAIAMQNSGSMSMVDSSLNINIGTNNINSQINGINGGSIDLDNSIVNIEAKGSGNGICSMLDAKDTTIIIENEEYFTGIWIYNDYDYIVVENSNIIIKNSGAFGIVIEGGNVKFKDSSINIENTDGIGIRQSNNTKMTLDNSSVTVANTGGIGLEIPNPSIIDGKNGGKFILKEAANLEGVASVFEDRGYILRDNSYITVIAEDEIPSYLTLTAGEYIWDESESLFNKQGDINWDKGYGLVIAGVRVDDNNADNITGNMIVGMVSYDRNTKTLTLKDVAITSDTNDYCQYGIYSSDDITIKLEGYNRIGAMVTEHDNYNTKYGIYVPGKDISIIGSGNLTIYDQLMGIFGKDIILDSTGNITIKEYGGGKACCLKAEGGTLVINSGNLKLSSTVSNSLYGDSIIINGGTITAQSESGRAFNIAPLFSPNYKCTIRTDTNLSDAKETLIPNFTEKYIKIEPKTSGGDNDGDSEDSGGSSGDSNDSGESSGSSDNSGGSSKGSDDSGSGGSGDSTTTTQPTTPTADGPKDDPKDEPVSQVKWANPFVDVNENSWFYEDVKYVYEMDLMRGTGSNTFSPNEATKRGMIVTILHRLEGSPLTGTNAFTDVTEGKYYTNAVAWASENKIVNGYGNDKFGPEDPITREQMAVILMNYAKLKGYDITARADLSKFEDSKDVSDWAIDAISWANAEGLIQGDGNRLIPKENATRAQVAAILNRFIKKIAK